MRKSENPGGSAHGKSCHDLYWWEACAIRDRAPQHMISAALVVSLTHRLSHGRMPPIKRNVFWTVMCYKRAFGDNIGLMSTALLATAVASVPVRDIGYAKQVWHLRCSPCARHTLLYAVSNRRTRTLGAREECH